MKNLAGIISLLFVITGFIKADPNDACFALRFINEPQNITIDGQLD